MSIKIKQVAYHRNGSAGTGFHVVAFDEGRGKQTSRKVAIVFPDRRSIAVLDADRLAQAIIGGSSVPDGERNAWDGPEYEDEVRKAILDYEEKRASTPISEGERRDLLNGTHTCIPHREEGGLILDVPDGACVICRREIDHDDALPPCPTCGASMIKCKNENANMPCTRCTECCTHLSNGQVYTCGECDACSPEEK